MNRRGTRHVGSSSQHNRLETFYDASLQKSFMSPQARELYIEFLEKKPICERLFNFQKLKVKNLAVFMEKFEWGILPRPLGDVYNEVVAQFYANIHMEDYTNLSFKTLVGDTFITVDRDTISGLLDIPNTGERFPLPENERPSLQSISSVLFDKDLERVEGKVNAEGAELHLKVVAKFVGANIMPSTCDNNKWTRDLTEFIFHILMGRKFNLCGVIVDSMIKVRHSDRKPGLPCLVSRICAGFGQAMLGTCTDSPSEFKASSLKKMSHSCARNPPRTSSSYDVDEITHLQTQLADVRGELAQAQRKIAILEEKVEYAVTEFPALEEKFEEIEIEFMFEDDE